MGKEYNEIAAATSFRGSLTVTRGAVIGVCRMHGAATFGCIALGTLDHRLALGKECAGRWDLHHCGAMGFGHPPSRREQPFYASFHNTLVLTSN
jgi:hypothetical protein